jgi:hypothetical protein
MSDQCWYRSSTFSANSSVFDFVNDPDGRRYHRYRQGSKFSLTYATIYLNEKNGADKGRIYDAK